MWNRRGSTCQGTECRATARRTATVGVFGVGGLYPAGLAPLRRRAYARMNPEYRNYERCRSEVEVFSRGGRHTGFRLAIPDRRIELERSPCPVCPRRSVRSRLVRNNSVAGTSPVTLANHGGQTR